MKRWTRLLALFLTAAMAPVLGYASDDSFLTLSGQACTRPPGLHCPDQNCPTELVINQGYAVEMETRRTYFVDYPCDLKPGEKVTLVLSLHGAGSYGNWQRNYFPIMDYVDKYRVVVATPNSPTRVWSEVDDRYLQNIVNSLVDQLGKDNIKSFWLVGHSQGGMTSNRLLRTDFFKQRVDGWLSLSGGRLGGNPGRAATFGPPRMPNADAAMSERAKQMMETFRKFEEILRQPLGYDISFIFETGEREMDDKGLPASSSLAEAEGCGAKAHTAEITDTKAGYVYDGSRQNPPNPAWGQLPRPGTADVYTFPGCRDGRVVSDVVRHDKGHTEGLEPNITETLVKMMVSAPGGRISAM